MFARDVPLTPRLLALVGSIITNFGHHSNAEVWIAMKDFLTQIHDYKRDQNNHFLSDLHVPLSIERLCNNQDAVNAMPTFIRDCDTLINDIFINYNQARFVNIYQISTMGLPQEVVEDVQQRSFMFGFDDPVKQAAWAETIAKHRQAIRDAKSKVKARIQEEFEDPLVLAEISKQLTQAKEQVRLNEKNILQTKNREMSTRLAIIQQTPGPYNQHNLH
jgi:hypothetical protein